jgi:hypothetical protein
MTVNQYEAERFSLQVSQECFTARTWLQLFDVVGTESLQERLAILAS